MYILYIYPQQFLLGSLCLTKTQDLQFAIKQNSPAKFDHSCAFSAERGFKSYRNTVVLLEATPASGLYIMILGI